MNKKTKLTKIFLLLIVAMMILPYIVSCESGNEIKNAGSIDNEIETNTVRIIVYDYAGIYAEWLEQIKINIYELYGMNAEIISYTGIDGAEKIATKLLAGDSDFDIYNLNSTLIPYYAKNDACLDLSSVKGIVDNFDYMFDGMKNLCSAGSKLCGVPLHLQMDDMWDCNIELAEKLGLDIERLSTQKMTWQEFYDFAVKTKAKAETLGINDFCVLTTFMANFDDGVWNYTTNYLDYMNKKVENKTTEYVEYLKLYIKMLDEGLIKGETYDYGRATGSILFCEGGAFDYINCDRQPFPKPLITAGDSYMIEPVILAINPKSPNIEAAKTYLEYSVSLPVSQNRIENYLLKNRNLYDASHEKRVRERYNEDAYRDNYEEQFGEQFGEQLEERFEEFYKDIIQRQLQRTIPTTNGHDVIAFMIKNGKPFYSPERFWIEVQDYALDVRAGNITPEEFADIVYKKSKMLIEE